MARNFEFAHNYSSTDNPYSTLEAEHTAGSYYQDDNRMTRSNFADNDDRLNLIITIYSHQKTV